MIRILTFVTMEGKRSLQKGKVFLLTIIPERFSVIYSKKYTTSVSLNYMLVHILMLVYIYTYILCIYTLTVSLDCRSLLILLMKKGSFGTQTPLSTAGETSIAV